jgi:hypothetical protein
MTPLTRLARLLIAGAAALALAVPGALSRPAQATSARYPAHALAAALPSGPVPPASAPALITRPELQVLPTLLASLPMTMQVPAGNVAYLSGRASGVQVYTCASSGTAFAWSSAVPAATLFNSTGIQIATHFAGPTWQASDGSSVVGHKLQSDAIVPDAIPWLLLSATSTTVGPDGGNTLSATTYIQRLLTRGGLAPDASACNAGTVGTVASIPYSALYVFYQAVGLTLSTTLAQVGQSITVTGTNFLANEPVQVAWDVTGTTPLATGTTDANGQLVTAISIPAGPDPLHTLLAVGQTSGHIAVAYLVVTPGSAAR